MRVTLARIFLCPFGQHARVWRREKYQYFDQRKTGLSRNVLRCTNCGECLASGAWMDVGREP